MKYFFILLGSLFLTNNHVYGQGIEFSTAAWNDVLTRADKENKLIYMDAFTTWCGPCKMMTKNIFPDPNVGSFFNENFINIQVDMEKGIGINLAQLYKVNAYPTHLIINGKGHLVHFGLGYMDAVRFVEFGREAIDPNQQFITLKNKYDQGERSAPFLKKYLNLISMRDDPTTNIVADEYFQTQTDFTTPGNMEMLYFYALNPSSPSHKILLDNKAALYKKYKNDFLSNLADAYYNQGSTPKDIATIRKELESVYPEQKDFLQFFANALHYRITKDKDAYTREVYTFLGEFNYLKFDYQDLNKYAWYMYENADDIHYIRRATLWAQESVNQNPQYFNYDTLAWLLFKTGKVDAAKEMAIVAIELGKKSGEDTSSTEELLKK